MARFGRYAVTAIALALLASGPGGSAFAQSDEDVERARLEAVAAAEARDTAGADRKAAVEALVAEVLRYETLTAQLTDITFRLAAAAEETRAEERAVANRRAEARRLVRQSYVAAGETILQTPGAVWDAADLVFASEVRNRLSARRTEAITDLGLASSRLDSRRVDLEALRTEHAGVKDRVTAMLPGLQDALDASLLAEAFAADGEQAALARYQLAAEELEIALARVSPGALRWRELVERYFPDEVTWAALQVLDCESRGNPEAVHEGSQATGLFQFLEGTWLLASAGAGFEGADRRDPVANVASAAWLVARSVALAHPRGAWGHWQCQPLDP